MIIYNIYYYLFNGLSYIIIFSCISNKILIRFLVFLGRGAGLSPVPQEKLLLYQALQYFK